MAVFFDKKRGFLVLCKLNDLKPLKKDADLDVGFKVFASNPLPNNPFVVTTESWRDKVIGVDDLPVSKKRYDEYLNYNIPYNDDFLYLDTWLASSVETFGANSNGDAFEADELEENHYTWLYRGVYIDHDNDDKTKAIGIILGTHYDPESERVRIILAIPRKQYPDICSKIESGDLTDVSLGLFAKSAECSVCGNIATSPLNVCTHNKFKGIKPGYYELNRGITGIEVSLITDAGADMNAKLLKVISGIKESEMKVTAAWLGQTFFPLIKNFQDRGWKVSTRDEVLASLKEEKEEGDKDCERFVAAMNDDEYAALYSQFSSGVINVMSANKEVRGMKIEELVEGLKTLDAAGFKYSPSQVTGEEEESIVDPEDVENKEDAQELKVIRDNTNNEEIEDEADEQSEEIEEEVSSEDDGIKPQEEVEEESEETDTRTNEDEDTIGGLDGDEVGANDKGVNASQDSDEETFHDREHDEASVTAESEVDSEAREFQEEPTPTEEIIEGLEQDYQESDGFGESQGLTSFKKTQSAISLEKDDVLVSRAGKKYKFVEASGNGLSAKVTDMEGKKTFEIMPHKNYRFCGRKGVSIGSVVSVRLPRSLRENSILSEYSLIKGKVLEAHAKYASIDVGNAIIHLPYDCLTGRAFEESSGVLSRKAILFNRPDWAMDVEAWRTTVLSSKSKKDLTVNLEDNYKGMSKRSDPVKQPSSVKILDKVVSLASVFPKGSKVRFIKGENLLHSKVKGLAGDEILLVSGRKIKASEAMSEGVFLLFSSYLRKNNKVVKATQESLKKAESKITQYKRVNQDLKDKNSVLASDLRKNKKEKEVLSKKETDRIQSAERFEKKIKPIILMAKKKGYGVFSDESKTDAEAIVSMKTLLVKASDDVLAQYEKTIKNFQPVNKLVSLSGEKITKGIPSVTASKNDEFGDLIEQMSSV